MGRSVKPGKSQAVGPVRRGKPIGLPILLGLSGLLMGAGLVGTIASLSNRFEVAQGVVRTGIDAPCRSKDATLGTAGPWGQLELRPILLAPPTRMSRSVNCPLEPTQWRLPASSWSAVDAWLTRHGLSQDMRKDLESRCKCSAEGCVVSPKAEWIVRITPPVRKVLYPALAGVGNLWVAESIRLQRKQIETRLALTTLPESAQTLVRDLSFTWDGETIFADPAPVCAMLDAAGRAEMMRFLHMEDALIVRLVVAEGQDVTQMVRYWSQGEFGWELGVLLESLARQPGGGKVDVINLLPPLPRVLLNTYPERVNDQRNCYWSAMNFMLQEPDERFLSPEAVGQERDLRYRVVNDAPRLGDVYEFGSIGGIVAHMAVHVADGVVFTKNGITAARPWILTTLESVRGEYASNEDGFVNRLRRIEPEDASGALNGLGQ